MLPLLLCEHHDDEATHVTARELFLAINNCNQFPTERRRMTRYPRKPASLLWGRDPRFKRAKRFML